jgi:hypothetical protein
MGFLRRLFGLPDPPPGVVLGGPRTPPAISRELEAFVRELQAVYGEHGTFDYAARPRTHAIGERINAAHGYDGMVAVCDTVRFVVNARAARELESVWDHIGEWRN